MFKILINNEVLEITDYNEIGFENGYHVSLDDGTSWYIFQDSETAGEAAKEYWKDLSENDKSEFACLVGESNLIEWSLGNFAGPGTNQVQSLQEWFDLWLDTPEEQWGSYDGSENECRICISFQNETGLENKCVCYRHN